MWVPQVRIARPTSDIAALLPFYRDGLGLQVLGSFQDHAGFDGIMLGAPEAPYHFEFTLERGRRFAHAPSADDLVVFYLPEDSLWRARIEAMHARGFEPVPSHNPYWDRCGLTFADPDGHRVVLQRAAWVATACTD